MVKDSRFVQQLDAVVVETGKLLVGQLGTVLDNRFLGRGAAIHRIYLKKLFVYASLR